MNIMINKLRIKRDKMIYQRNQKIEILFSEIANKIGLRKKIIMLNILCRKHPKYMAVCTISFILFLTVSGFVHDVLVQQDQSISQTEIKDMDITYMFDNMQKIQDMKKVEQKEVLSKNTEILNVKKEVEVLLAKKNKSSKDSFLLQNKFRTLKILLNK